MKLSVVLLAISLAACSRSAPEKVQQAAQPAPTFNTTIPINEVMAHVVNPAAFQFWAGYGYSTTAAGTEDLSPTTEEEWKGVEDGAATVIVAMNTVKMTGYAREPNAAWYRYADRVAALAALGMEAAERKEKHALETIGSDLEMACEDCHRAYIPSYAN